MDCSMPGSSALLACEEFAEVHVHWVTDALLASLPLLPPSPFAFYLSQPSGSFPMNWLFTAGGHGEGNGNPLQCSWLENPRDRGAWWAAVYGVAQSWTRLKWLRSSSSRSRWPKYCSFSKIIQGWKDRPLDLTGGLVVENLPASTEDTGSTPGLGRYNML